MDAEFVKNTLAFIESNSMGAPGKYRYSHACTKETLYSSSYAAMTYSLFGKEPPNRQEWIDYICSFQDDDGLFGDPVIAGYGWYEGDPLWCGRTHLSCHVTIALKCLGAIAPKEISFLKPWEDSDRMIAWLETLPWTGDVGRASNEIMNVGVLLQYERDFHGNDRAGRAVEAMLDWLSNNYLDPKTGVWGNYDLSDPVALSNGVREAYHWWELFFYDGMVIPAASSAAETILRTQNPLGGFGLGFHNPENPYVSSACEDIDSLVPLARLYQLGIAKNERVKAVLEKGLEWVKSNQMLDGGFVFMKDRDFEYGHPELLGATNQGAMFPTWFRTLTIALVSNALGIGDYNIVRCPGYQFSTVV